MLLRSFPNGNLLRLVSGPASQKYFMRLFVSDGQAIVATVVKFVAPQMQPQAWNKLGSGKGMFSVSL